jgi:hypothetical protein
MKICMEEERVERDVSREREREMGGGGCGGRKYLWNRKTFYNVR